MVVLLFFISSCEIKQATAPNWLVDANLPLTDKYQTLLEILEDDSNIYVDSLDNVIFSNESNSSQKYQKDIKINGQPNTAINLTTQVPDTNLYLQFDDSSFVTVIDFEPSDPPGLLTLNFNPAPGQVPYNVNLTITNLFNLSTGNPCNVTKSISTGTVTENIDLSQYRLVNSVPTNLLNFRISTTSSQFLLTTFSYSINNVLIKYASGRIKPVNLGVRDTMLIKPFGDYNFIGGVLNFNRVNEERTYLVVKRIKGSYQTDIKNIMFDGINANGRRVKFKYLRYDTAGAPPQPIDSVFNLRLPAGLDSMIYYVNPNNSNVLQFFNNLPQNIFLTRNTIINSNYGEGVIDNSDSISIYLSIEVPLHFSIIEPPTLKDTIYKRITGENAREKLQNCKNVDATLYITNGLPLYSTVRMYILDTNGSILFSLIDVVTPYQGDSVYVPPAPVDQNGYVLTPVRHQYNGVIDSVNVLKLLDMHKIAYQYELYTDPNIPPTIDGRVRARGGDFFRHLSFGTFRYFINNN
ncbi:MAG: hypothetical protein JW917_07465 [Ignavibacteria bacterium]|nr:hypothetical protein [Ignavibacteria bacterium]